ncbi:MAG: aldehyde ferredoxin oxidoreductase N-terminal domain-containing protein [Candidatus Heimdallarchaeota archaeon]
MRHLERCVGCLCCVMACARERYNTLSIDKSAIHVKAAGQTAYYGIVVCRGCKDPVCMRACPSDALVKRKGGGVLLDPRKCDACGLCADAYLYSLWKMCRFLSTWYFRNGGSCRMKLIDVDLSKRKVSTIDDSKYNKFLGGVALATEIFTKKCKPDIDPLSKDNVIVFANGPLTAAFPTASKTVALFKSPLNNELGESYAGGRMASALRFAGYDGMIIHGKASHPTYLAIHNDKITLKNAELLWNLRSVFVVGRILRDAEPEGPGRRSFIRSGRAGDRLIRYANLNVDNYRHFGRLGLGAVFGSKNLKAVVIEGSRDFVYPDMKAYKKAYREIYNHLRDTDDMDKYHILGTAAGIQPINAIGGLPTRNFSSGRFEFAEEISGEYLAENLLLRKIACSQCPVGCIHIAYLRVPYKKEEYDVETTFVPYDYELLYALGSNLGIGNATDVLRLIEVADRNGFDIISLGGILAWATDAYQEGIITINDTMGVNFEFGNTLNYLSAVNLIVGRENELYEAMGDGIDACIEKFGGKEFAISIGGQTPAGYFTGQV